MTDELSNKKNELISRNKGHRKRIKEKVLNHPESLFKYELIETLLFGIISRKDTKPLAKEILEIYDQSFSKLFFGDLKELSKIKGVGNGVLVFFKTISEIIKKLDCENFIEQKISLENFDSLLKFLKSHIAFAKKENFCEIFLNSNLEVMKFQIYDYGTHDQIAIYSKDVVFRALECGAKNIVISHNHPTQSKIITPSEHDKEQTAFLNELCISFEINLLDHIIVSGDGHFSFYSNGLL